MNERIAKIIESRFAKCKSDGGYRLDLSHTDLREVPRLAASFPNLQQLNLANNNLKELPDFLFSLTNLKVLSLQKNRIEKIPTAIANLDNLIRIDLKYPCKINLTFYENSTL